MEVVTQEGPSKVLGSVMVVGGGIAGIQAALDLAESGYYVHLVEKSARHRRQDEPVGQDLPHQRLRHVGIISPKLVECGRHLNIELLTLSEITQAFRATGEFHRQPEPTAALCGYGQVHRLRPVRPEMSQEGGGRIQPGERHPEGHLPVAPPRRCP